MKKRERQRAVPLRVLNGASLAGLRGVKAVLEAEIALLQTELQEIDKRINEKTAAGLPDEEEG